MSEYSDAPGISLEDLDWIKKVFANTVNYLSNESNLVFATQSSIVAAFALPMIFEKMKADQDSTNIPYIEALVETISYHNEFAEAEKGRGFQTVFGHGLVSVWTALEALVHDLTLHLLRRRSFLLGQKPFSNLKLTVQEHRSLSEDELLHLLIREAERETKAESKLGAGKFEALLNTVGLGGAVQPEHARNLLELQQTRNILLHRAGLVDYRFRKACPWRSEQVGESLQITREDYLRLHNSATWYIDELVERMRVLAGLPRTETGVEQPQ